MGKLSIPNSDEEVDEVSDTGEIEFNEIAYTEFILSIDAILSRDVRTRKIWMIMRLVLGRSSRINMNLCLLLTWSS